MQVVALQLGVFLAVYPEGSLPRCKATSQVESPVACPVVWKEGCLGDQEDPIPNSFHQTRAQDLALCKGFLTSNIRPSSHPTTMHTPMEWDGIPSSSNNTVGVGSAETDRWKPSRGRRLKRGIREREIA